MPSTIEAVDNLAPFLGSHLQSVTSLPPRDALDHWDAHKEHIRTVVMANFPLERMGGDNLAACVLHAFERVWATIPPGRLSGMEAQSQVVGIVYRIASQMHAVRELLKLGHIESMQTMMTPVVFRDRKSEDLPKPGADVEQSGTALLRMAMGGANLRLKGGDVDKAAYAKQLRLTPVMRVGLDDRSQHFKTAEGFYAGTPTDYGASKTPVFTDVTLGGRTSRVHKSAAAVQAFRFEAFGWDEMGYTMPVAIVRDMLQKYGDKAIEIVDAKECTPLKKTT